MPTPTPTLQLAHLLTVSSSATYVTFPQRSALYMSIACLLVEAPVDLYRRKDVLSRVVQPCIEYRPDGRGESLIHHTGHHPQPVRVVVGSGSTVNYAVPGQPASEPASSSLTKDSPQRSPLRAFINQGMNTASPQAATEMHQAHSSL